jgi:serine protease Do
MFWKKTGLVCIVLAALAIVGYAQPTKPRAHSANLQVPMSSGYLGVFIREVSPEGVEVTGMAEDAPAAKAGLHVHDVILDINGQKVDSQEQFVESISGKTPGTKINLTLLRNGAKQTISATLGTRPAGLPLNAAVPVGVNEPGPISPEQLQMMIAAAGTVSAPKLGFEFVEMLPQLAAFFGVTEGVLVESVAPRTSAEKAGLKAGDVITKVNGLPVNSVREVFGIVRQANKKVVVYTVVRNKKEMTLNIEVAWNRLDQSDRDLIN